MNVLVKSQPLPPVTPELNQWFESLIGKVGEMPPADNVRTEHHFHAGMYSRTLYVPAGSVAVGLKITVETQLIASGHFQLTDGAGTREFDGHFVFDGSANRRAAAFAITDSAFTMIYPTKAKTIEEAEKEFTDQPERLMTNHEPLKIRS